MARQDGWIEAVEEMLLDSWRLLQRMPDREKGFLKSGSGTWWPDIVRTKEEDWPGNDAPRAAGLGRREVALVEAVWTGADALVKIVPADRTRLVGTVIAMKARPERAGFRWERVWQALGGRASGLTSDAMRSRYETQLARMAAVAERRRLAGLEVAA